MSIQNYSRNDHRAPGPLFHILVPLELSRNLSDKHSEKYKSAEEGFTETLFGALIE